MLVSELYFIEAGGELYITNRYARSGLYILGRESDLKLIQFKKLKSHAIKTSIEFQTCDRLTVTLVYITASRHPLQTWLPYLLIKFQYKRYFCSE